MSHDKPCVDGRQNNLSQPQWLAVAQRTRRAWSSQDVLEPLETLVWQGCLRTDASETSGSGRCDGVPDGQRHRSQETPHHLQPGLEKGGRGRLIGRTKGGMSSNLHAVTAGLGRLCGCF